MPLIRLIQDSGALKNGPIFSLKMFDNELENLREIVKEKDVIIENNNEKIKELESYVSELEGQCTDLQKNNKNMELEYEQKLQKVEEYTIMPSIMEDYEKFICEITASQETLRNDCNTANAHLANLEFSFADLIKKYERLKDVVMGYKQNQEVLLQHIDVYKQEVTMLQERYEKFKEYAIKMLKEANEEMQQKDKKHISEMAKVKSRVLQSKVKISELEKTISIMSTNNNIGDGMPSPNSSKKKSVFTPLSNNFVYDQ